MSANAGAPLAVVQSLVGHSSPTMTMHYYHGTTDAARAAVNALPSLLEADGARSADDRADAPAGRVAALCAIAREMTDGELAAVLRVSPRALRDYRNDGILPYIRMKGNILYKESDIEKVLKTHEHKEI